jgi:hypothetical protein
MYWLGEFKALDIYLELLKITMVGRKTRYAGGGGRTGVCKSLSKRHKANAVASPGIAAVCASAAIFQVLTYRLNVTVSGCDRCNVVWLGTVSAMTRPWRME